MKTLHLGGKQITRQWHLIDASEFVLGRLASKAASLLMGKHKINFSKHLDVGDFVVVTNVEKVKVTGKKYDRKLYRTHSGYPKGFKEKKYSEIFAKNPEKVIQHAVSGMLPENRLKTERLKRLNVVVGNDNPFEDRFKQNEKN